MKSVLQGLSAPLSGFRLIRNHRSLWALALAPGLITVLFVVGTLSWAWVRLNWIMLKLLSFLPFDQTVSYLLASERDGGWFKRFWDGLVSGVALTLIKAMILGGAALLGFVLASLICGTLWEFLAAQTIKVVRKDGKDVGGPLTIKSLGQSVVREAMKGLLLVMVPLGIGLFSFFPVVGIFFGAVLSPLCAAFIFSFSLMDYAFSAEEFSISKRASLSRTHFLYLLTSGLYVFVPALNILFIPFLVANASAKYAEK